jgi:rhodanese-related sulfurtransferase
MPSINTISPDKLERLLGTPKCPTLVDVRTDEDFVADPRLIPGARRRPHADVADWGRQLDGASVIAICQRG